MFQPLKTEEDILPEKYRVLINKNWSKIKNSLHKQHSCELKFKEITIYAENIDIKNISLCIKDNQKTKDIIICKKANYNSHTGSHRFHKI